MSNFPQRQLGTGRAISVSAIGLGCMGMSPGVYGAANDDDGIRVIHRALDLGVSFLDTAEVYGGGHNETLVGKAIAGRRDQVFLASKFGLAPPKGQKGYGALAIDGRPENVKRAIEGSLRRLNTDHLDLYYQHRIDHDVPVEETIGAMGDLVRAGKVRFIGISEANADTIRRAHAEHELAAVQSEFSLWSRDIVTNGVFETLRDLGIALVSYSPLGRGFLTGQVPATGELRSDDFRRTLPRFQAGNVALNRALVDRLEQLARSKGATAAQIALAWVLSQGDMIIPIPGTTRIERLEENAAAVAVRLEPSDLAALDRLADEVAGERYPDMNWVNR
jgi:aryl-alcohol dehydrogenase-like predicted oxidoreductase